LGSWCCRYNGAISFFAKVKRTAIRHLAREGVFDEIHQERIEALLPAVVPTEVVDGASSLTSSVKALTADSNDSSNPANQRFLVKRNAIVSKRGADTFTGALKVLSREEKAECLNFSAVTSIVAGL
jgi:hypothetical protein